ncbi:hypothetical protein D9M68_908410 [compost metagenome]
MFPFKMRANLGVIYDGNQGPDVVVRKMLKCLKDAGTVVVIPESQTSQQPGVSANVVVEPRQVAKLMPIGRAEIGHDGTLHRQHERTAPC